MAHLSVAVLELRGMLGELELIGAGINIPGWVQQGDVRSRSHRRGRKGWECISARHALTQPPPLFFLTPMGGHSLDKVRCTWEAEIVCDHH